MRPLPFTSTWSASRHSRHQAAATGPREGPELRGTLHMHNIALDIHIVCRQKRQTFKASRCKTRGTARRLSAGPQLPCQAAITTCPCLLTM